MTLMSKPTSVEHSLFALANQFLSVGDKDEEQGRLSFRPSSVCRSTKDKFCTEVWNSFASYFKHLKILEIVSVSGNIKDFKLVSLHTKMRCTK